MRGEGDAQAIRIFADAFGQDVEFFTFYRSMQAYRDALGDDSTSFVLSPDSEFFRYFDEPDAALQSRRRRASRRSAGARRTPPPPAGRRRPRPRRPPATAAATVGAGEPPAGDAVAVARGVGRPARAAPARALRRVDRVVGRARGWLGAGRAVRLTVAATGERRGGDSMIDLATALALVLVLEGLLWARVAERHEARRRDGARSRQRAAADGRPDGGRGRRAAGLAAARLARRGQATAAGCH